MASLFGRNHSTARVGPRRLRATATRTRRPRSMLSPRRRPRMLASLMRRAGRAAHKPGTTVPLGVDSGGSRSLRAAPTIAHWENSVVLDVKRVSAALAAAIMVLTVAAQLAAAQQQSILVFAAAS